MNNLGEHSRKTRSDGDDEEGPFKKARYVWQLKGKYHLKEKTNSTKQDTSHLSINNMIQTHATSDSDSEDEAMIVNNNNGTVNNNTICNERCCLDDLLTHSAAIMDESHQELSSMEIDKAIDDDIPISMVKSNIKNDEFLYKWQARQVAKSFVDNTINSILEHWKIAPFDATDFVENCENSEQVEDDGILMAIQSHGLQSSLRYSAPNSVVPNVDNEEIIASNDATHEFENSEVIVTQSALDNLENTNTEGSQNDVDIVDDPMDFLNAAVSVAIQKQGLTSYNYG